MAKLSEDLKHILAGLAYQDAGEFLSRSEKMKVLNGNSKTPKSVSQAKPMATQHTAELSNVNTNSFETDNVESIQVSRMVAARHIVFISNGEGINAPLDYAIESSLRQNAQIDLLIHGAADTDKVNALEKKINDAGVYSQQIQISGNAFEGIIDYVVKQPSLIFIIATPTDTVAMQLTEEISSRGNNRIHVPFVLINDERSMSTLKQSAA